MQTEYAQTGTYWASTLGTPTPYPVLTEDLEADVVILGAGIVGLTAAQSLARAGISVVVLEARRVATQATARSTAKISSQHGMIYRRLIRDFGEDNARKYAQANEQAIQHIADLVFDERIACSFERKPAYIYTESQDLIQEIEHEAVAAQKLGLPAHLSTEIHGSLPMTMALRFDGQAQFNPAQYLSGLASAVATTAKLFEMTRVIKVDKESDGKHYCVQTEAGNRVRAKDVIIGTHLPIVSDGKFFAKAYTFSHPMAAAEVDTEYLADGMFISADTPSHSFRFDASHGAPHIVAVGPTFKTGVAEEQARSFEELERFLVDTFGVQDPAYRWTNEDFQSMDGLPFIGSATASSRHLYVATGFNAWGISNGTFAAILLTDLILGRANPCAELFDASRIKPVVGGPEFLKGNLETAKHFIGDRLLPGHPKTLKLRAGQAVVADLDGQTVAAYRDDANVLHTVSAVCTHMGCIVGWNATDRTWDCPCHGSRFEVDGEVAHGPATTALKRLSVPDVDG